MTALVLVLALLAAVVLGVIRVRLAWRLRDTVAGIPWDEIRRVSRPRIDKQEK